MTTPRLLASSLFAFSAFVLLAHLAGCKMPNDGVPIYMKMDSVSVSVQTGQGGNSHGITDVWVEANTDNLGAYGLPCNFPVLQQNDVRLVVNAGISESAQSGVRVTYPFYTTDTFSIVGTPGTHYSHKPVFRYVNAAQFSFVDDFNVSNGFGPSSNFSLVGPPDTDPTYGGTRCIKLNVSAADSNMEIHTTQQYDLPEGQEIWMELDYRSEVPFYVGFYGNFSGISPVQVPVVFITPKPTWTKIYVKLSNFVGNVRADTYQPYFEALRPYGSTGGNVYIDNIKLVHF